MLDGTIHHKLVEDSTREYSYDAEQQALEDQMEQQNDPRYVESSAKETRGEPVGYKVFEDFVYEKGNLVRRENTTREDKYSYL